jgi:hypothetical protein
MNIELMQEMLDFGSLTKAERVHSKCLKFGKFAIARKIRLKYKIGPIHDDLIFSMSISMSSLKR